MGGGEKEDLDQEDAGQGLDEASEEKESDQKGDDEEEEPEEKSAP